jgi:hypothetical protein
MSSNGDGRYCRSSKLKEQCCIRDMASVGFSLTTRTGNHAFHA